MWFITTIEKIVPSDSRITVDLGDMRTWGYLQNIEEATQALHNNVGNMRERLYEYAVIENISEGLFEFVKERRWFKWSDEKQGFYEINEPDGTKNLTNIAIG